MLNNIIDSITRGFLSSNPLVKTINPIILSIEQGILEPPIEKPKYYIQNDLGGGPIFEPLIQQNEEENKKIIYYVTVKCLYDGQIYTETKYINKQILVTQDNIDIEIIDNKPKITLKNLILDVHKPNLKIKII